jgi:hypothetical protein
MRRLRLKLAWHLARRADRLIFRYYTDFNDVAEASDSLRSAEMRLATEIDRASDTRGEE